MVDIPENLTGGLTENLTGIGNNRLAAFFWVAAAVSVILPRIPYGRHVLYPFALLGTWVHEMGHGPAIAGGIIIILGSRESTARWVLAGLAIILALSLVLFVRNAFGWFALGLIAALLGPLAIYGPEIAKVFVAQLIGIQFCMASWGTLDYMFTKNFQRDGQIIDSDTQEIAEVLLLRSARRSQHSHGN